MNGSLYSVSRVTLTDGLDLELGLGLLVLIMNQHPGRGNAKS